MTAPFRFLLAVVGVFAMLATASVAAAQPLEPLTTETFITSESGDPGTSEVTGTCSLLGPSTFDFVITGVAVGPYPGTFRETGSVSLTGMISPLVSFEAHFTVTSPQGAVTVRGKKTLQGIAMPGLAVCGVAAFGGLSANALSLQTNVNYAALITTSEGAAIDRGVSNVTLNETQLRGEPVQFNGFSFLETFQSTSFKQIDDDDDDDDDGDD
jgi:hypothetical protein